MLYFVNVPYNCSETELKEWIESQGIQTRSIRIIHDLEMGVSPAFAYVELRDNVVTKEAISALNGKRCRNQPVQVTEARARAAAQTQGTARI